MRPKKYPDHKMTRLWFWIPEELKDEIKSMVQKFIDMKMGGK